MPLESNTVTDWLQLVQSEYLEIPGLILTRSQVQRLWGLDPMTCDALLEALVAARFLRKTSRGAYVLAEGSSSLQRLAAKSSRGLC